jgi:DNA-binding transcriptional regulator YhcF (GntR family)
VTEAREEIVDALRSRVLRGLQTGTLRPGNRMPTSRELAPEFDADYRAVILAYKQLQKEGLLELRPRGGVYITLRHARADGASPVPELWIADVLTAGLAREIAGPDLSTWLQRCVSTLRLRAAVIADTEDQLHGLGRELREDFGFDVEGILAGALTPDALPSPVRHADILITTGAHAAQVRATGEELHIPTIVITVRPELLSGEWALLLRHPVYAVVASQVFGDMLREHFARVPGIENLHVVVFGRDDLSSIPAGAPTYVTQRVRAHLGQTKIPGRILPPARTISSDSAREIFTFLVRANVEAMSRIPR